MAEIMDIKSSEIGFKTVEKFLDNIVNNDEYVVKNKYFDDYYIKNLEIDFVISCGDFEDNRVLTISRPGHIKFRIRLSKEEYNIIKVYFDKINHKLREYTKDYYLNEIINV
jgi:hypothetical protein